MWMWEWERGVRERPISIIVFLTQWLLPWVVGLENGWWGLGQLQSMAYCLLAGRCAEIELFRVVGTIERRWIPVRLLSFRAPWIPGKQWALGSSTRYLKVFAIHSYLIW